MNCQFRHRGTITANGWTNDRPFLGEYIDTIIRSHSIQIVIIEGPENVFWRRRQQVPPKRQYLSTKVHGVTTVTLIRYSVYCDTIRIWFCGRSESVFGADQISWSCFHHSIFSAFWSSSREQFQLSLDTTHNPTYTVAIAHEAFM